MKKTGRFPLLNLAAVLLAAGLLFPFLYFSNNKYTWGGPQPIAGLLYVSESDLNAHPLRFLVREWAFFPDILLTPDDFSQGFPDRYMRYVGLGQYGGMDLGEAGRSPHGSGTYLLELSLPEAPRVYTIELPIIFSAYRFYLNDELMLQIGDPTPDNYRSFLQRQTVTFFRGGSVRLLLAVTDRGGVYSGITSPPAFGEPRAVGFLRELRNFAAALAIALAGGALLTALYFAVRLERMELWLFSALCACLLWHSLDTLLYTYIPIPGGLFPLCFIHIYSMYPLTLLLHHSICGVERQTARIPLSITIASCICFLLYGILAPLLDYPAMRLFSGLILLFKWAFAAYLLITSIWAMKRACVCAEPEFLATVFLAASLVADRLMPLYEPLLGGWFIDAGRLALLLSIGCSLGADFAKAYRFQGIFEQERRMMERQLTMQDGHFTQLSGKIEETRRLVHDFRHHLRMIRAFAQKKDFDSLSAYIDDIGEQAPPGISGNALMLCTHPAADALLQYYSSASRQNGIAFHPKLDLPPDLPFPAPDLCVILGNLLENALEACLRQVSGPLFIRIKGNGNNGQLILTVENSYNGESRMRQRRFLSSKHGGIGIGTESVRMAVRRYGGIVRFLPGEQTFQVQVLIQLPIPHLSVRDKAE